MKRVFSEVLSLTHPPADDENDWFGNAKNSIEFLKKNFIEDEIVIYANGPFVLIHSVLVQTSKMLPIDKADLLNSTISANDTWFIDTSVGGSEEFNVYLSEPLESAGSNTLKGGENLVIIRTFDGVDEEERQVELSQKLIHSLDLFFVEDRKAFCRLDNNGDLEDIIKIYILETDDPWQKTSVVTILSEDLFKYMAVTETTIVSKFDFTRYKSGQFISWDNDSRGSFDAPDLFYNYCNTPDYASYVNGWMVLRSNVSKQELIEKWKMKWEGEEKSYASFKIYDPKNEKNVETSCSPEHIVNYFTESNLPWEISPVFFRAEVLQRYKSDSEKYIFEDRSLSCRNAWSLKTYDINDEGQVHTYIGYLAALPYEEQLYWQVFNEWPEGNISKRAYENDILGEVSSEIDPLHELKRQIELLDKDEPIWWKPRRRIMLDATRYPVGKSINDWGNELLNLDHLIVEGFQVKGLRALVTSKGGDFDKNWRSLGLLKACLEIFDVEENVDEILKPLHTLHNLRNPVKAHADPKGLKKAVKDARMNFGDFRNHYKVLVTELYKSLSEIRNILE